MEQLEQRVRARLADIRNLASGSIGDQMEFTLLGCDPDAGEVTLRCRTFDWMRNIAGTLHGGICATVVDQAMGFVAHCVKRGEGTTATVELQVSYHRPLIPGEYAVVKVKVISVTRSLIRLAAECWREENQEKICLTATAAYFNKQAD